jgi:hypothetical protein
MEINMFSRYAIDKEKEKNGVWSEFDLGNGKPWRFKIARLSKRNAEYLKCVEKIFKPYRRVIDYLDKSVLLQLEMKIFIEAILKEWQNVTNEKGEPLELNPENAMYIFEKLPDIYETLKEDSENSKLFLEEEIKEDSKN